VNAFLEIVGQLVAAISPSTWQEQRFFPYRKLSTPVARVFDACVFRQDAWGALGILWLEFAEASDLLVFPFRLARYSEDGDLISLTPWSLREASNDAVFFDSWKAALAHRPFLLTERGAQFRVRSASGRPNLLALNVFSDSKSFCTRIEQREALKVYRLCPKQSSETPEVEILEYLNQQKIFLNFPNLVSVFEYSSREIPRTVVATTTSYISNNGSLWHDYLARLQHARFPTAERMLSSLEAWHDVKRITEALGRTIGEFHRAMSNARENPALVPEGSGGEQKRQWLQTQEQLMRERLERLAPARTRFPRFAMLFRKLEDFANDLFRRLVLVENPGLRIRIHGRVHLGHILNAHESLILFDFGSDPSSDLTHLRSKQSALEDLATLNLSLRYAWSMTERRASTPILDEFIGFHANGSEVARVDLSDISLVGDELRTIRAIEAIVFRSYQSVLSEDSTALELIPASPSDHAAVYEFLFFMRTIRECARDFASGNPRCTTSLRILDEFCRELVEQGAL
jgi:hypothetical protein